MRTSRSDALTLAARWEPIPRVPPPAAQMFALGVIPSQASVARPPPPRLLPLSLPLDAAAVCQLLELPTNGRLWRFSALSCVMARKLPQADVP